MNASLMYLEIAVLIIALLIILVDLWAPEDRKKELGLAAAFGLAVVFLFSFTREVTTAEYAFGGSYVMDPLALWFKRFFLLAGVLVSLITVDYSRHVRAGVSEYHAIQLLALVGMMFAASANNFMLLFVSLELITVSFYILVSFLRHRTESLEAGVKYLILGALSSGFLIYGIALIYGTGGTMAFEQLSENLKATPALLENRVLTVGFLLLLAGLGFKLAIFPFQVWAPDVYQGAPTPSTAFLAIGSKAAGIVLLMRLLGGVVPDIGLSWEKLLMVLSAATILYGSLCAIPQRNLKRLMGYSSIASAGFLLMGFAAASKTGSVAILYYLGGYLFTVAGAFAVIAVVVKQAGAEDVGSLAGLSQRSPLLAATLALAMVSLAGIPPLAGFFGKFLLFKAVIEHGVNFPTYYALLAVAIFGVIVSLYYYLNVVRAVYWSKTPQDISPLELSTSTRITLVVCIAGMLWLGMFPNGPLEMAGNAVAMLHP